MFKSVLYFLIACCFVFFVGCKKGIQEPLKEDLKTELTAISDTGAATPGDVVALQFNGPLEKETYQIAVGAKIVTLSKTAPQEGQFVVPVLAPGAVSIDLNAAGIKAPLSIVINNYQAITDPDAAYMIFKGNVSSSVDYVTQLSQDTISPASSMDVELLKNFQKNADALYASLSNDEKIEACYFLAKAKFDRFDFSALRNDTAMTGYFKTNQDARSERFIRIGEKFVIASTTTVAGLAICVAGMYAPEPTGITKLIGIGGAAAATLSIIIARKALDELGNEIGIQFSMESLLANQKMLANPSISLRKDVTSKVVFYSKYRTLMTTDVSNSSLFIQGVFTSINSFQNSYNRFIDGVNTVRSWFLLGPPVLAPFTNPVKTALVTKTIVTPAFYLKLNNVSDPDIKISYVKGTNTLNVTATSTTVTTKKSLTVDIIYENTKLGITNKQTIDVSYSPGLSPGDSYQGGIVGYIFLPGDLGYVSGQVHGIILAPTDQGQASWGCYGVQIFGTSYGIGTGQVNTQNILTGCSEQGIAARICNDLVLNGYSDWYLPSYDEFQAIRLNGVAPTGGYKTEESYWTSTNYTTSTSFAEIQWFYGGVGRTVYSRKDYTNNYVLAVRSF